MWKLIVLYAPLLGAFLITGSLTIVKSDKEYITVLTKNEPAQRPL